MGGGGGQGSSSKALRHTYTGIRGAEGCEGCNWPQYFYNGYDNDTVPSIGVYSYYFLEVVIER